MTNNDLEWIEKTVIVSSVESESSEPSIVFRDPCSILMWSEDHTNEITETEIETMEDQPIEFDDIATGTLEPLPVDQMTFIPNAFDAIADRGGKIGNAGKAILNYANTMELEPLDAISEFAVIMESQGEDAPHNFIGILNFYQHLMNKICWNARRLLKAQIAQEEEAALGRGIWGLDSTQEIVETIGVNCEREHIAPLVKADFYTVMTTQLAALEDVLPQNSQVDIELFMFDQSVRHEHPDGKVEWLNPYQTNNWDEAVSHMDHIAITLREEAAKGKLAAIRERREKARQQAAAQL